MKHQTSHCGFTLVELLVVLVVLGILTALAVPATQSALRFSRQGASMSNLRQLAVANLSYAADNGGFFCPAQDMRNNKRWHGERSSSGAPFDPTRGFLAPYLGESGRVKMCPLVPDYIKGSGSWENGSGGYGYNATYLGGTPANGYQPNTTARVPNPAQTVMFTTTAFAKSDGLQEYPYTEPYQWVDPNGRLSGDLQPSTHFRAGGKALVAWCDGRVSAEKPSRLGGANYYGGNNVEAQIGWFGPERDNGYWNPDFVP